MILDRCPVPIVLAPLAGGPSTSELAAAVSEAGGLGFLAAGYLSASEFAARCRRLRELTARPFGVNLFVPGPASAADDAERAGRVAAYAREIEADAAGIDAELGQPRHDDDAWQAKLAVVLEQPPPVVSFTFGIPERSVIDEVKAAGSEVWITVTTAAEARQAADAGADAVAAQGAEAGGHRASFADHERLAHFGLLPLLDLVRAELQLPLVASGGIASGPALAAVLCAGARAAQIGTAFMLAPEAGTHSAHREALARPGDTVLTRAFTGRMARGIRNAFIEEHEEAARIAYPELHYLTAPIRRQARQQGDPERMNLWAGEAHQLAVERPAGETVRELSASAAAALERARAAL